MAYSLKDLGNSLQNLFNQGSNAVQQNIVKPLQQSFNNSAPVQGFQAYQKAFTPSTPGGGYWTTPSAKALVNIQKSTPAFQQHGVNAFGSNFLNNNVGFKNYIPQMTPFNQRSFKGQLGNMAVNLPSNVVGGMTGSLVDVANDVFRKANNKTTQMIPYNQLKSPISKLSYNSVGIKNKPQEVIGNVSDTLLEALNFYLPGAGESIVKEASKDFVKKFVTQTLEHGIQGAKFMGTAGALQGLSENRDKSIPEQLVAGGKQGLATAPLGFGIGAGLSATGGALGTITQAFERLGLSKESAQKQAVKFIRDAEGKFAKKGGVTPEPKWIEGPPGWRERNAAMQTANLSIDLPKTKPINPVQKIVSDRMSATEQALKKEGVGMGNKLQSIWQDFKTKFVSSRTPITDIINEVEKKGTILSPEANIKYQFPVVQRAQEIGNWFATKNGLVDTIKNVDNPGAFSEYLKAKHQITGDTTATTGLNLADSKKIVAELGVKYEPFAKSIRSYVHKLLDYRVERGLMSQEVANGLKAKYPDYIPLNRIFSPEELPVGQKMGKGIASISQTGIKSRVGSDRAIQDPLYSLIKLTESTFKNGETNKAAQILASYKDLPGNPFQLRQLKTGENAAHFISVFENGKKVRYETTPEIESVAKNLDTQQMGFIAKLFSYPVRILKTGATGVLNPVFTVANYVKDQGSAALNSDKALQTSLANPKVFVKALAALTGRGADYDRMMNLGLQNGTSFDIYRESPKLTIESIRSSRNLASRIKFTATHPEQLLRYAEDVVSSTEKLTRNQQFIGTRDTLIKEGKTPQEATILAGNAYRQNTIDFADAGTWGKLINQVIPYFNAGMQGSRKFVTISKDRPLQTAAKLAIGFFTPMAAVTAWNMSDPKRQQAYNDIQDWEKKNNLIIVPPNPQKDDRGGWNVIKIPLSQEPAYLTNLVRRGVESVYGGSQIHAKELLSTISGTITPFDFTDPQSVESSMTPQLSKSGFEIASNKNMFTGKDVVPRNLANQTTDKQVYPWTSGTARKIGGAVGLSPITIENAVSTNLGSGGKILLNASDQLLNKAGAIPKEQIGGTSIGQAFSRRFASAAGGNVKDQIDKAITKGWDAKTTTAWDFIHSAKTLDENGLPSQDREETRINAALRIAHPELLKREAMNARAQAAMDGTPVNPLYDLPYDRQLIALRLATLLPGDQKSQLQKDNIEWLKPYWNQVGTYSSQMKALGIYKDNPNFEKAPVASVYAQSQMDAKNWNDPEVQAYLQANTEYKNKILAEAGLPPLPEFGGGFEAYTKKPKKVSFKISKGKTPKAFKMKMSKAPKFKMPKNTFKLTTSKAPKIPAYKIAKTKIKFSKKFSLTS